MKRHTITFLLRFGFDAGPRDEHEVEVGYDYEPATTGYREPGTGLALEPDTPLDVRILSADALLDNARCRCNVLPLITGAQMRFIVREIEAQLQGVAA